MTVLKHEMKINAKSLLIWTLCVGLSCFGCILLYTSMEDSIKGMADSFSDMGVMSQALGMDKMSLATLSGYYATEIAIIFWVPCLQLYWVQGFCQRKRQGIPRSF